MAARDERARRERIRQSIRAFYDVEEPTPAAAHGDGADGNDDGAGGPAAARPASKPAVPGDLDIDSEAFNAFKYTTQLLKHQTLPRLVETDNGLRRQVKGLDGELQALVYGNYTKFLTATDTIRQVRSNVADMDERLQALGDSVSSMDTVSRALAADLETHRANIESVLAVNTVLRKVQFLVRLPDVLRRAIDTGRLHAASRYWVAGDAVLAKYSHIPAFERTRKASQRAAEQVYVKLCQRVTSALLGDAPSQPAGDSVDSRSATPPTADASARSSPAATPITAERQQDAAAKPAAGGAKPTIDDLSVDVEMLRLLAASSIEFDSIREDGVIKPSTRDAAAMARAVYDTVAQQALGRFDDRVADVTAQALGDCKRRAADVKSICASADAHTASETAAALVVALEKHELRDIVSSMYQYATNLRVSLAEALAVAGREHLPTVDVSSAAMAACQPALEAILESVATSTKKAFSGIIGEVSAALARRFASSAKDIDGDAARSVVFAVHDSLATTLGDFSRGLRGVAAECLRTVHVDHVEQFSQYSHSQLLEVFAALGDQLAEDTDPLALRSRLAGCSGGASTGSDAALCEAAFAFLRSAIAGTLASATLPELAEARPAARGTVTALPRSDAVDEIRRKLEEARRRLVYTAIGRASASVSADTLAGLDLLISQQQQQPSSSEAPKQVSAFATALTSGWTSAARIVDATVWSDGTSRKGGVRHARRASGVGSAYSNNSGDGSAAGASRSAAGGAGRASTAGGRGSHADGGSSSGRPPRSSTAATRAVQHLRKDATSMFTSDVDRLFARPSGSALVLKPSQIDGPHVIECVISRVLTTLIDEVRELDSIGGAQAFQQLQVDATYAHACVCQGGSGWTRKLSRVQSLLDEFSASAYDRTTSRAALPADAVLKVVAAEEKRLGSFDKQ